jgi:predicted Zn-dependent peptidase
MSNIQKTVLKNGVTVLVEPISYVQSAAIGLWCRTGSRHEFDNEAGITHLIEHMLFKGTKNRTAKEIAESIEGRGGALNAFTDKESTCYYCRVLSADAQNGVEVLSDMMLNSLIDPEELAREEMVVIEEIKRSEDEPESYVHELHLENRWKDHPLGKPIIGTRESVASFKQEHIREYMSRRYRGENVFLSIAGNVDPAEVVRWAEQYLDAIQPGGDNPTLTKPSGSKGELVYNKPVEQVHFCIGGDACENTSPDIYTLRVLDGVLGSGMSSRLFQEIREKRGLAYSVGSYSMSYSSGGAFTVYGGTSPETWDQVRELVRKEIDSLINDGLHEGELEKVKRNLMGGMVLGLEGMNARMSRMARNEMIFGREIPIEEVMKNIEAVTEQQVRDMAANILREDSVSITTIAP